MKPNKIIQICIVLAMMAAPALAADFKMPGFAEAWGKMDSFVQEKFMFLIMIAVVILIVAAVLATSFGGTKAAMSTAMGDVAGRSHGISSVVVAIGVVFLAVLGVGFILWIAG
jgi:hypothetical protein